MLLVYLSCACVAGIFLGSKFNLPLALVLTGLLPLPLIFFYRHHKKTVITAALCLGAIFGGASYYQASAATHDSLPSFNGSTIEIKGLVIAEPDVRDKVTHVELSAQEIKIDDDWQKAEGVALLFVPRYPAYRYGDVLQVRGKLETPLQFDDFDYRLYLARQGIYSTMLYPQITVLEKGNVLKPLEWIYSLRSRLSEVLSQVLSEPQASLAQGIVLGIRSTISTSLKNDLSRSGTAHLLAISGLNLSIIAGILVAVGMWLFGRRRYIYVWLALGLLWLYSLITGMQPPVVRSAIMASLFLLAELAGRQRSAIVALSLAAALMIVITPQILWSASFQLSFLAMAGLIFVTPALQTLGRRAVHTRIGQEGAGAHFAVMASDSLCVTLGAIIAVWPVVAYYFGIVSFVGPAATFLTAPSLPAIIVTGALAAFAGLIAMPLAQVTGWFAWLFLSYMLVLVHGFSALPLSSAQIGSLDARFLWAYYPILSLALWLFANRTRLSKSAPGRGTRLKQMVSTLTGKVPGKWVIPPLLAIAVLTSFTATTMPDNNLHISFLDVGEGDAILIQTPSRQNILIDGGPSPQAVCLGLSDKMPFWDRTIDLIVLTHPHADHLTGLVEVLRRYDVKQVLAPDLEENTPIYQEWLSIIKTRNIEHITAQPGHKINLNGDTTIEVLNPHSPPPAGTEADMDNNSMVLRVSLGEISFLLTSDIQEEAEYSLIGRRADLACTVLKVAHHGSHTSTTPEFLAVARPQLAIISVGADNRFGHPDKRIITRLEDSLGPENVYRTDEQGTIEFITDGQRLWKKTEK